MTTLHEAPTHAVPDALLRELRAMLERAFDGRFSGDDWIHALGGLHVWKEGAQGVLSHAALVERTLVCGTRRFRVGYVEAMATVAERRGEGHGTSVMRRIGERIQERHELGALSTSAHGFYERLGWERWRGRTFVDSPRGRRPTPDDDGDVLILRTPRSLEIDLDGAIVCDWRARDVW